MPHAVVRQEHRRRARQLRRSMTRAKTLLWRYIKAHRVDGFSFRRQGPMRGYIVYVVCHSARLIVELDGESHDFQSRVRSDAKRDEWLVTQGYLVLRFTNEQVLTNLEGVIQTIRKAASSRVSLAPPSLSLPHKGGG